MKPFNFAMQKVLDLRTHYENEAKVELGRAVGVLTDLENKLIVLAAEQNRASSSQFQSGNDANTMQQYMYYLIRLENIKEQLLKETAIAELKVEEARELYIEASRERKVLDKLKEKKVKEHRKYVLYEEAKELDDTHSHSSII